MSAELGSIAGPLADANTSRRVAASDGDRMAWQREMEQAQANTWFKGGPIEASASTHEVRPQAVAGSPAVSWATLLPAAEPLRPPLQQTGYLTAGGQPGSGTAPSPASLSPAMGPALARPTAPASYGAVSLLIPRDALSRTAGPHVAYAAQAESYAMMANTPAVPALHTATFQRTGDPGALSLHVAWTTHAGVDVAQVWIGAPAAHAADVPAIARWVRRWLEQQGVRVDRITCNGQPCEGEGVGESPALPFAASLSPPFAQSAARSAPSDRQTQPAQP